MTTPFLPVEPPARSALPYGLFSVLTPRGADSHWSLFGVTWEALSCEGAGGSTGQCDSEGNPIEVGNDLSVSPVTGSAESFHVSGSYSCSLIGGKSPEEGVQKALEHLLTREESRVEQALWNGDLGNTGFAAGAVLVGDSAGAGAGVTVGALEKWLGANYGSLGVLHMDRLVATYLLTKGTLVARGSSLYSVLGTPVVSGAGYPGTDPSGSDPSPGTGLIYATPTLIGYRSEPTANADPASSFFDPSHNDFTATATRSYAIGFDPCGTAYAVVSMS